ncbi:MAG: long-chain N-acyl amino acid synthase [Rubrivivax sp.]|nr:long-chain N-acyl amino acid synthase [Rubrivivax sp.]
MKATPFLEESSSMQSLLAFPFNPGEVLASAGGPDGFKIRAADSHGVRSSANILVNRRYASRGYQVGPMLGSAGDDRLTLVAADRAEIVGTLTVGFDSPEGLLVDDLFKAEADGLRAAGQSLCEFTKLAMEGVLRSQRVLAALFHVAFIQAHCIRGCDTLLIEVNPRHVRYYEVKLGFKVAGPRRHNRRVNAPAVLMALDLWQAHQSIRQLGGNPELMHSERSLYPLGFSAAEEAGITTRLRRGLRSPSDRVAQ